MCSASVFFSIILKMILWEKIIIKLNEWNWCQKKINILYWLNIFKYLKVITKTKIVYSICVEDAKNGENKKMLKLPLYSVQKIRKKIYFKHTFVLFKKCSINVSKTIKTLSLLKLMYCASE